MPIINCPSCGAKTNTAICPGWWNKESPGKCLAKFVEGVGYEQGCGYHDADGLDKRFADSVINGAQTNGAG